MEDRTHPAPHVDAKYATIFEHSAVPLWEEDVSRLRSKLHDMKIGGTFDLRAHLAAHPEFVLEAVGLIDVTDVNLATLRLFEAERKEQLLGPLPRVLDAMSLAAFGDTILAIEEGKTDLEVQSTALTLKGKRLSLIVKTYVPLADAGYPCMIVSCIDITARMQAEDDLRKAKEYAEDLIKTANVMVLGLDLDGLVTIVNGVVEEITGYARTELMNRSWFEIVVPKEQYPDVWREFKKLAREGSTGSFETPILTKSGEERYIAWQNRMIRECGRVTGMLSFGLDITRRRRIEQDLDRERTFFNLLMENLPDHLYFKDSAGRFTRASRSHARGLGLDDPSLEIGKTDADFFSADHARKAFADEQRIIHTGEPLVDIEEKVTYPAQPDAWFITTKMPLRDPGGSIVGTFGISHDITMRKRLEEKNQQLATLVESADDAIVGLDLDRRITVWNRGAERLYWYTAEEMIGALMSPLIPPGLEDEVRLIMERLARGERITNFETTPLRKDGSKLMVSFTFAPIHDTQGKIVGIASVARDVTAQKAMQAQVNRAQRLESLATLAGGVAHQFNNINTIVRGYLTLLQSEKSLTARLASYVEEACAGVQQAVDITDRLMALTEPGGSSHTLRLDVLARTLLQLHAKRIQEEKVRLLLDLADTPLVQGNEVRLRFVLSSLVDNALDSLLDQPVRMVSVRTGGSNDEAWFEVEDTGCGIPKADLPRLFCPFFSAKGEWAPPGLAAGQVERGGIEPCHQQHDGLRARWQDRGTEGEADGVDLQGRAAPRTTECIDDACRHAVRD